MGPPRSCDSVSLIRALESTAAGGYYQLKSHLTAAERLFSYNAMRCKGTFIHQHSNPHRWLGTIIVLPRVGKTVFDGRLAETVDMCQSAVSSANPAKQQKKKK